MLKLIVFFVFLSGFVNGLRWNVFKAGGSLGSPHLRRHHKHLPPEQWFEQNLDHFNPIENGTWKQRYFTNDQFYKPGGPVFLMIGGEGPITNKWMVEGQWIEYAKQFNALCFQLEHRYYGKSHPTSDLGTKNLIYLNSEQALADLAFFIQTMNEKYGFSDVPKWIVFGGSYPGSLAAWVREKYPHLVHGAVSSSAPLLAAVDFREYFMVVKDALATHSDKCVEAVKNGTKQLEILMKHMIGMRSLDEKFRLCDPIERNVDNALDNSNIFETLAGNFAGIVQYNKDNRMSKDGTSNITIDTLCDIMVNEAIGTPLDRLAEVNSLMLNATDEKCLDYKYDNMISKLRNTSWDSEMAEGGRQWMYQTCTEFGFYQTSSQSDEDIFGKHFPVDFFIQQCKDIFGSRYSMDNLEKAVERTNIIYGALNIPTTRIVFVHGSIDPWHALGITKSMRKESPAVYIKGTAHCANMYPARDSDLPQLNRARQFVGQLIKKWLKDDS
ncbi:LOW QUALITY PROTEIN: putative serine protease F56F10.1 [Ctenocephalides felis]|uniref:LOW QUALITY PROTEIN: putative serine protease F56F10.1 n=1 Tax=Ctenocephalides felis TaxID=7515 RepID=UPI000E6E4307|nr:LOW QUALITY PROTEIN: putative serine protease F56F10.1 [Ctenocephalides felis]